VMRASRGVVSLVIVGAATTAAIALACIIPDTDIYVFSLDQNEHAVRFVEGIPLSEDARCACDPNTCECPIADQTSLPPFLDPTVESYQFCICGEGAIDENRLNGTRLFAEDQDEFDGVATDDLYAALLLDWNPTLGVSAFDYVAYRSYVDPSKDLDGYFSSYESQIIKRPRPYVRAINLIDDTSRFDLCNGAGKPLTPGFHTLTVMVTDKPWYRKPSGFADTGDDTTSDTGPEPMEVEQHGVPDIAEGATYDIETYVFHCFSAEEADPECQCEVPPEE
jgi:hypothetical protein